MLAKTLLACTHARQAVTERHDTSATHNGSLSGGASVLCPLPLQLAHGAWPPCVHAAGTATTEVALH